MKTLPTILLALLLVTVLGCGAKRPPIPVGEIPPQLGVAAADEEYGQQVFRELAKKYPLDTDDKRIAHVREVTDRLTRAAQVDHNPWHVHVFDAPDFANAAATRGNFLFVWSGLFRDLRSEAELAGILAHELAHVLAGHTAPNPFEETTRIISGVVGDVAGQVVSYQGPYGILADLASLMVRELIEAALINPDSQANELEADQVGLFIMADAGYNPEAAYEFWTRVKDQPGYRGGTIPALSSHPSSAERLTAIKALLGPARVRYEQSRSPTAGTSPSPSAADPKGRGAPSPSKPPVGVGSADSEWIWNSPSR